MGRVAGQYHQTTGGRGAQVWDGRAIQEAFGLVYEVFNGASQVSAQT